MTTLEAARDGVRRWIRQLDEAVASGELNDDTQSIYQEFAIALDRAVVQAVPKLINTEPAPY